ncbi:unnamed protein product [Acanthocheilonema viteae]|uniref:Uncharacterized protein n=1 Tax=Acanthocheilonema viteae TaxID=6277 RepID=A0A498STD2_ACAVI|nr:unnamed protein product [Acanthocheilonema viteae]
MNILYEPRLTCAEEIRFLKLNSFDVIHFWNKKVELPETDKALLYKGIRNLDNELIKLVEAKEDKTKIYKVYLKIGHISLLAKDFPRALSSYQKAYNLNKDGFWKEPASYFGLGLVYFHFKAFKM